MAKEGKNRAVLCISDLHMPHHHIDTVKFLRAVKKKYSPDRVILLGDEIDGHSFSFHDKDPDLPFSPSAELDQAINYLSALYELFPKADIMESNHGSLIYRKGKHHGLPRSVFKSYADILGAPRGWKWHPHLTIRLSNKQQCYFCHGIGADVLKVSQSMAMNVVQGHYHNKFKIDYWSNPHDLFWGFQVGCSIDDKSLAFAYNKLNPKRPLIGHGIIIDGHPKLLPMVLNKKGRWIEKLV